jgi:hypothetical protein
MRFRNRNEKIFKVENRGREKGGWEAKIYEAILLKIVLFKSQSLNWWRPCR